MISNVDSIIYIRYIYIHLFFGSVKIDPLSIPVIALNHKRCQCFQQLNSFNFKWKWDETRLLILEAAKCPDPKFSKKTDSLQVVARKRQSLNKALRELCMGRWMIKFIAFWKNWLNRWMHVFRELGTLNVRKLLEADLGVNVAAEASVAAFLFTEETFAQSLRRISFRNISKQELELFSRSFSSTLHFFQPPIDL